MADLPRTGLSGHYQPIRLDAGDSGHYEPLPEGPRGFYDSLPSLPGVPDVAPGSSSSRGQPPTNTPSQSGTNASSQAQHRSGGGSGSSSSSSSSSIKSGQQDDGSFFQKHASVQRSVSDRSVYGSIAPPVPDELRLSPAGVEMRGSVFKRQPGTAFNVVRVRKWQRRWLALDCTGSRCGRGSLAYAPNDPNVLFNTLVVPGGPVPAASRHDTGDDIRNIPLESIVAVREDQPTERGAAPALSGAPLLSAGHYFQVVVAPPGSSTAQAFLGSVEGLGRSGGLATKPSEIWSPHDNIGKLVTVDSARTFEFWCESEEVGERWVLAIRLAAGLAPRPEFVDPVARRDAVHDGFIDKTANDNFSSDSREYRNVADLLRQNAGDIGAKKSKESIVRIKYTAKIPTGGESKFWHGHQEKAQISAEFRRKTIVRRHPAVQMQAPVSKPLPVPEVTENSLLTEFNDRHRINYDELTIGRELAGGNFGKVYLGEFNENVCVIKQLRDPSPEGRLEVLREAVLLSSLRPHASITAFYGACVSPSSPLCIVMEYIEGGALGTFLANPREVLTGRDVVSMMRDLASGLAVLHKDNILHLDTAPRNLLLLNHESPMKLRITDFGLSRKLQPGKTTYPCDKATQVAWRSIDPIVCRDREFSRETDIWAYGVCCWSMLARTVPYSDLDTKDVLQHVLDGGRLQRPENRETHPVFATEWLRDQLWAVVRQCFNSDVSTRRSCMSISRLLAELLKKDDEELNEYPEDYDLGYADQDESNWKTPADMYSNLFATASEKEYGVPVFIDGEPAESARVTTSSTVSVKGKEVNDSPSATSSTLTSVSPLSSASVSASSTQVSASVSASASPPPTSPPPNPPSWTAASISSFLKPDDALEKRRAMTSNLP